MFTSGRSLSDILCNQKSELPRKSHPCFTCYTASVIHTTLNKQRNVPERQDMQRTARISSSVMNHQRWWWNQAIIEEKSGSRWRSAEGNNQNCLLSTETMESWYNQMRGMFSWKWLRSIHDSLTISDYGYLSLWSFCNLVWWCPQYKNKKQLNIPLTDVSLYIKQKDVCN